MRNITRILTILSSMMLVNCGGGVQNGPLPNDKVAQARYFNPRCPGAKDGDPTNYGGGTGTKDNPYLICSVDQFERIRGNMADKRYFKLATDIDFSEERDLEVIAISPAGSIDGDNHKIKNLTLRHGTPYSGGIYGSLARDMNGNPDEIKNLIIENVTIIGDGSQDMGGVVAGANWAGIISNVHVTGKVQIESPDSKPVGIWNVGGLVGTNESIIEDSSFDGVVAGTYNVGGIAGLNRGTIKNSKMSGTISGSKVVGGVVGAQMKSGIIQNSISSAAIDANQHIGNPIGYTCNTDFYQSCEIPSL